MSDAGLLLFKESKRASCSQFPMPNLLFGEGFSGSGIEDMGGGGHGMGYLMGGGAEKKKHQLLGGLSKIAREKQ